MSKDKTPKTVREAFKTVREALLEGYHLTGGGGWEDQWIAKNKILRKGTYDLTGCDFSPCDPEHENLEVTFSAVISLGRPQWRKLNTDGKKVA